MKFEEAIQDAHAKHVVRVQHQLGLLSDTVESMLNVLKDVSFDNMTNKDYPHKEDIQNAEKLLKQFKQSLKQEYPPN